MSADNSSRVRLLFSPVAEMIAAAIPPVREWNHISATFRSITRPSELNMLPEYERFGVEISNLTRAGIRIAQLFSLITVLSESFPFEQLVLPGPECAPILRPPIIRRLSAAANELYQAAPAGYWQTAKDSVMCAGAIARQLIDDEFIRHLDSYLGYPSEIEVLIAPCYTLGHGERYGFSTLNHPECRTVGLTFSSKMLTRVDPLSRKWIHLGVAYHSVRDVIMRDIRTRCESIWGHRSLIDALPPRTNVLSWVSRSAIWALCARIVSFVSGAEEADLRLLSARGSGLFLTEWFYEALNEYECNRRKFRDLGSFLEIVAEEFRQNGLSIVNSYRSLPCEGPIAALFQPWCHEKRLYYIDPRVPDSVQMSFQKVVDATSDSLPSQLMDPREHDHGTLICIGALEGDAAVWAEILGQYGIGVLGESGFQVGERSFNSPGTWLLFFGTGENSRRKILAIVSDRYDTLHHTLPFPEEVEYCSVLVGRNSELIACHHPRRTPVSRI